MRKCIPAESKARAIVAYINQVDAGQQPSIGYSTCDMKLWCSIGSVQSFAAGYLGISPENIEPMFNEAIRINKERNRKTYGDGNILYWRP